MAEATPLCWPFLISLVLFPLLISAANGVHHFEEKVLNLQKVQWKQESSIPKRLPQNSRRVKQATILEMKHIDDYHSSNVMSNRDERQEKRLIMDNLRVQSLQSQIKRLMSSKIEDVSSTEIPLISGIKLQTLNYVVSVELGNQKMAVIVDTGSDLTWVQCQPCKSCYNQQGPLFNPSQSLSYQSIMCNSTTCQSLQFATGNSGLCSSNPPTCNYIVNYGDGSYTHGELGRDNMNLGASTLVNNFIFGCGRKNEGLFGGASGLMGLGRSDLSFISQTFSMFGGVFAYCLPSSTESQSSGSLIFGNDSSAYKNSTPISYTNMVTNPQLPTFYFLNLTGISVGGVAIPIRALSVADGGVLIDSGTVITRLVPSIYKEVRAEFLEQFSGFPPAPAFSILDTCFNLSGYQEVNIPTIKMDFGGDAEMSVDVNGVFYFVKVDASQVCLALASLSYEDEVMIIGNYQQKNTRIVYDTKGSRLGFAEETCSLV